jgi:hypothetical protein
VLVWRPDPLDSACVSSVGRALLLALPLTELLVLLSEFVLALDGVLVSVIGPPSLPAFAWSVIGLF